MAEVRKKEVSNEYQITKEKEKKSVKKEEIGKKSSKGNESKKESETKKSLWVRFRIFCHGVKSEAKIVHWTSKKDVLKYSIATVLFVGFCSLFFYIIDVLFALVQSLIG